MFLLNSKFEDARVIITLLFCFVECDALSNDVNMSDSYSFRKPIITSVLFDKSLLNSERCWSRIQISKLHTRLLLQDLLPVRVTTDNAALLYSFIRLCIETTKLELNDASVKIAVLKVMADMFGGYQHTYGLPLLKQLSYEGNINFKSVDNCFRMQDELKIFLNTDGLKWSPPVAFRNTLTQVRELNMTVTEAREKACTNVFLRDPRESASNGEFEMYNETMRGGSFPIPLPIFDDYMHPKAVILPLKERRFASLTTENGHNLLLEYYIRSTICLKRLSRDWYDNSLVADFDNTFKSWIVKNVVPHLHTGVEWYPAFSGLYRILITITKHSKDCINNNDFGMNKLHEQHQTSAEEEHDIAVRAHSKMLIFQNNQTIKADQQSQIWQKLIGRIGIVTLFSTVLLLIIFMVPIIIFGYKNLMTLKNCCTRYYKQSSEPNYLKIKSTDSNKYIETNSITLSSTESLK